MPKPTLQKLQLGSENEVYWLNYFTECLREAQVIDQGDGHMDPGLFSDESGLVGCDDKNEKKKDKGCQQLLGADF